MSAAIPGTSPDVHARPDDGWSILAMPPGERDLAHPEPWLRSRERSLRRRELPRRGPLARTGTARLSAALAVATLIAPAADVAAAQTTGHARVDSTMLRTGSRGAAVAAAQRALGVGADGVFGPVTARAVRAFQRAHGLTVDGVIGPRTASVLGLEVAHAPEVAPVSRLVPTSAPALGIAQVRAAQRALGVTADGVVGPRTRAAVRAYETAHGLRADGVLGAAVLRALGIDSGSAAPTRQFATAPVAAPASGVAAAVAAARSKVGAPYRYGATGPSAFDCSGLTSWAMRQAGVALAHSSFGQYAAGTPVARGDIRAGDLVFFDTAGPGASDVGIATGPATAISATTHGVMDHPVLSGYWGSHFVGVRRVG